MSPDWIDPFGFGNAAAAIAVGALISFMTVMQFALPTALLARCQPRRTTFGVRVATSFLMLTVFLMLINLATMFTAADTPERYASNLINYSLVLVALVPAVLTCFRTGIYNALFCVTAGYTLQNLGSGLCEATRIVLERAGHTVDVGGLIFLSSMSCLLVTALAYRPFISRTAKIGHLKRDAWGMLGMLALVICVVIAYDVAIRGLGNQGASFGFLMLLRVVHAAVCIFILYAEYQMLYNVQLKAEMATFELLSAERARQYEISRETIAAVNRRVHDIRHAVLRELTEGNAQVDRSALATIARDIDVYGTAVKTGNDALDTILTEYALLAERKEITLSCIADGTALAWMDAASLYTLFGDLLDQVLKCEEELPPQERAASLTLRSVGTLAVLHVEYPALKKPEQETRHEFSQVQALVERLDGTVALITEGTSRIVDIMLPRPQEPHM